MIGASIDFGPAILAHAKSRSMSLSDDDVIALGQTLNSAAEIEVGDHPVLSFGLGGDRRGDLHAALDIYATGYGKPAGTETRPAKTTPSALKPGAQNATALAIAKNAEIRAGSAATKQQQARQIHELFGNPWSSDRLNRTHQAYIVNHNPELARQLKQKAGVRA